MILEMLIIFSILLLSPLQPDTFLFPFHHHQQPQLTNSIEVNRGSTLTQLSNFPSWNQFGTLSQSHQTLLASWKYRAPGQMESYHFGVVMVAQGEQRCTPHPPTHPCS